MELCLRVLSSEPPLEKSLIIMLPIINLPATDMTALLSLLGFVKKHCTKLSISTPTKIFDQPLHVKAYKIAPARKVNIFILLDGFNQLMS